MYTYMYVYMYTHTYIKLHYIVVCKSIDTSHDSNPRPQEFITPQEAITLIHHYSSTEAEGPEA